MRKITLSPAQQIAGLKFVASMISGHREHTPESRAEVLAAARHEAARGVPDSIRFERKHNELTLRQLKASAERAPLNPAQLQLKHRLEGVNLLYAHLQNYAPNF